MVAVSMNSWVWTFRKDRRMDVVTVDLQPTQRAPKRRKIRALRAMYRSQRWDTILFAAAGVLVLVFLMASVAISAWRGANRPSPVALAIEQPVITVTVHPGDTLWRFASRYGDPNRYILDRVDSLAHDNHVAANATLVPGQHLRVAVTNPVEVAKIRARDSKMAKL
jgi:LysM repeat protein